MLPVKLIVMLQTGLGLDIEDCLEVCAIIPVHTYLIPLFPLESTCTVCTKIRYYFIHYLATGTSFKDLSISGGSRISKRGVVVHSCARSAREF